ncbi:MAG: hypothetical protein HY014_10160 [Acidobacteria bacterium]|nr:hypothetical protein [Acidobacteriota bacterium]MBI3488519.1 hypothetical protein [Acidobacteriota bacterium]
MKTITTLFPLLLLSALPALAQCGSGRGGHSGHGGSGDHSAHVQEAESKGKATNTICPVMGQPVKPGRDREVVVRGNHYLVCCDGCGPEMSEHDDKYLDPEGRPLNDPKRKAPEDPKRAGEKPAPSPQGHEGHLH